MKWIERKFHLTYKGGELLLFALLDVLPLLLVRLAFMQGLAEVLAHGAFGRLQNPKQSLIVVDIAMDESSGIFASYSGT